MKARSVLPAVLAVWALLCAPASGQDVTGHHVLSNGMEVRLFPLRSTPLVATLVLVRTGYALEGPANLGYSHLLEHLVFAGTAETDKEELFRRVDAMGAYLNGFTRDDYMGYIAVARRDDFQEMMGLLSGILFDAALRPEDLDAAREVVIEEIGRFQSRPGTRSGEMFQALLYEGSPYARTGLGNRRTVSSVSRDEIAGHYRRVYRPDNMILLAAGGVDAPSALAALESTFGRASPGASAPAAAVAPPLAGRRLYRLADDLPDLRLRIAFNGPDPRSGDAEALELLGALLGGEGGLLMTSLEGRGLSPRSAEAGLSLNWGFSRFLVSLSFAAGTDGEAALAAVLEEVDRAAAGKLDARRIDETRGALVAEEVLGREKLHYYLMGKAPWVIAGAPGQGFSEERWRDIDGKALAGAATRHLAGRPYMALLATPAPPGGEPPAAEGLPRSRAVLPNGLVVVAEQRPGSEVFALNLLTRHRLDAEPPGKAGIADFLHRMLPLGTKGRTRRSLERDLRKAGASLSTAGDPTSPFGDFYTSRYYTFLRVESPGVQAGKVVELAADMVGGASFPADEVEKVRGLMTDYLSWKAARPESLASRLLAEGLLGGRLGGDVLGDASSIASISREDLRDFRRDYLTGRNIVIAVVSGLPPDEALSLVGEHFSGLPAGADRPALAPGATGPGCAAERSLGKAQGAVAFGAVTGEFPPGQGPALAVVEGILNDRLNRELREKEGLAYSVGASLREVGGRAVLAVSMGTSPGKIEEARAGIRSQIEGLGRLEVTAGEIARRVNALTGRLEMRMLSSLNRGFYLALAEREGRGHTYGEDYRRLLLSLGPAEVQAAARSLAPEHLCEAVVR